MTVIAASTTRPVGLRQKLNAYLADRRDMAARRAVYRTTVRELNSLTTRELDDLGIPRGDIHTLAHEAAFGSREA